MHKENGAAEDTRAASRVIPLRQKNQLYLQQGHLLLRVSVSADLVRKPTKAIAPNYIEMKALQLLPTHRLQCALGGSRSRQQSCCSTSLPAQSNLPKHLCF